MGAEGLYLARFSVTFRSASCFFARFLAAASFAIFKPSLSRLPGSGIYYKQFNFMFNIPPFLQPKQEIKKHSATTEGSVP